MGFSGNNQPIDGSYAGENRAVPETVAQESVVGGPEPHYSVPNEELPKNSSVQTGMMENKIQSLFS